MHCYLLLFTVMKLERKLERNIEQVKPEVLSIIKRFSRYKWGRMTVETEYLRICLPTKHVLGSWGALSAKLLCVEYAVDALK